jgi:hypothetical protein
MPELRLKATELTDTQVDFVSLVKRGANRIPFRIVKAEDEGMLDLTNIGRQLFAKSAEPKSGAAKIVAAIVPVGTNEQALAKLFKSAGIKQLVKTESKGFVSFAKADAAEAENTVVIKSGDKIALVVSGVRKAFDAYNGTTGFTDRVKAQTYYSSYYTAKDVLLDTISEAMQSAANPKEASDAVGSIIDEFKDYVTMLLSNLPAEAFYVDRNAFMPVTSPYMGAGCMDLDGPFCAPMDTDDDDDDAPIIIINKADKKAKKATKPSNTGTYDVGDDDQDDVNDADEIDPPANAKKTTTKKTLQPQQPGHNQITGNDQPNVNNAPGTDDDGDDDAVEDNQGQVDDNTKGVRGVKKSDADDDSLDYSTAMKGKKRGDKKTKMGDWPYDDAVNTKKGNTVDITQPTNLGDPSDADNEDTDFQDPNGPPPRKAKAMMKSPEGWDLTTLSKKDWTDQERKTAAQSGAAMPDGSFPIENKKDLKDAIGLAGQAKDPDAARRHIMTRARSLGAADMIPDSWRHDGSSPAMKGDSDFSAVMKAALGDIQKSVSTALIGLSESVSKQLAEFSVRIEEVNQRVQKTDEALNGVVFADAGGDRIKPGQLAKSAGPAIPPLLDTAYMRAE